MPAMEEDDRPLFWPQLRIVTWKNWQIKKNFWGKSILEIVFPLFMLVFLLMLKSNSKSFKETELQDASGLFNRQAEWPVTLYVAPNSPEVKAAMDQVLVKLNESKIPTSNCTFFASSTDIDMFFLDNYEENSIGIVFNGEQPGVSPNFTLRFSPINVPPTTTRILGLDVCRNKDLRVNCLGLKYFTSGFSLLQDIISSVLLKGSPAFLWQLSSVSLYPIPAVDIPDPDIQHWSPIFLTFSFAYLINIILVDVVVEKENRTKQALLLMGTQLKAYWCATFLTQAIKMLIIIACMVVILYFADIFPTKTFPILICLLVAYGFSVITLAFALSTFFKKAQVAGTVGFMVTLIVSFLYLPASYLVGKIPPAVFYIFSLLPPTGFTFSVHELLSGPTQQSSSYSHLIGLGFLVFDIFFYGFLAFYLDNVIPGEYGARQSPFFLFQRSYRAKPPSTAIALQGGCGAGDDSNPDVEPISEELRDKDAIQIIDLVKVFSKKNQPTVKAVNGLSLTIYEGQITALLGHNGAGKSTLIHMLTGVMPPTRGQMWLYGRSPAVNLGALRHLLGVCLQDDVVHPCLSSVQHLLIFAGIKGIVLKPQQLDELLEDLGLNGVKDLPACKLSGGLKRKLCVGLALVGDPKVIILDEPTTGVDVASRYKIWDLLRKRKDNRVIIMTTHSMEEADILADRKAIICKGKLKCAGTSLFLKNRFGIGYHLNVEVGRETVPREVVHLVRSHVPKAQVIQQTISELSMTLPWDQASQFPTMFTALEKAHLSHGITMTTLEEVFLRLGVEEDEEEVAEEEGGHGDLDGLIPKPSQNLAELESMMMFTQPNFLQSLRAILYSRFLLLFRNPLTYTRMLLSPFVYCLIAYLVSYHIPSGQSPPLALTPQVYTQPQPLLLFNNSGNSLDSLVSHLNVPLDVLNQTKPSLSSLDPEHYMALDVKTFSPPKAVKIQQLVNGSFAHALPVLQSLLTGAAYGRKDLEVGSHPLPPTKQSLLQTTILTSLGWVYVTAIYLVAIPVELAVESVADRESGVRAQLRAAGLSFPGYWLPMWLSHNVVALTAMAIMLGVTMSLGMDKGLHYAGARIIGVVALVLCNFGSLLLSYCLGHIFQREATAMQWLPLLGILPVIFFMIVIAILAVLSANSINLTIGLFFLCLLYPFTAPMNILIQISTVSAQLRMNEINGIPVDQSIFYQPDGHIMILIYAVVLSIPLYSAILWVVENLPWLILRCPRIFAHSKHYTATALPADEDVTQEESSVQTILDTCQDRPSVLLNNVHKEYKKLCSRKKIPPKVALQRITLGINCDHIFALMGPNGAGKTTLIKILVAEQYQTSGQVMIEGCQLKAINNNRIFKDVGYCPQDSNLIKNLTIEEHLALFASIRGIPSNRVPILVERLMDQLGISSHSKKWIKNLSGGTKRKLCLGLSLLGLPKILILDEPTTGVDPQSRAYLREMLGALYKPSQNRRCLILTTHSIEDVEALCSRVAILVKGSIRCLGTTQHLKSKYGTGYMLEAKLKPDAQREVLKNQVKNLFPDSKVQETQPSLLVFAIPHVSSLGPIFEVLEEAKSRYGVEEYSFSQTTLEQVFLRFAREQENAK